MNSNGGTCVYNYVTVYPSKIEFYVTQYLLTYIYSLPPITFLVRESDFEKKTKKKHE